MLERHKKSITMEKMKEFYKKKFSQNVLFSLYHFFCVHTGEGGERKQFCGKIYILFCNSSM